MTEADLQLAICDYIRLKYPGAIFNSDGAGNNVSMAQAGRNTRLRSDRGYPDLFIAEPRGKYHGLYLELKREGTRVWLRNGQLADDEQIRLQEHMLERLQQRGYAGDFAIGYKEAVDKIDIYMGY